MISQAKLGMPRTCLIIALRSQCQPATDRGICQHKTAHPFAGSERKYHSEECTSQPDILPDFLKHCGTTSLFILLLSGSPTQARWPPESRGMESWAAPCPTLTGLLASTCLR